MQFGFALPHVGTEANKEAIVAVAQRAEALGFDSLWVLDRLLWPSKPTAKYPGTPDGRLPKEMQVVYDPLTVLTFVAASTQKVQLGTSVLVATYRESRHHGKNWCDTRPALRWTFHFRCRGRMECRRVYCSRTTGAETRAHD